MVFDLLFIAQKLIIIEMFKILSIILIFNLVLFFFLNAHSQKSIEYILKRGIYIRKLKLLSVIFLIPLSVYL